MKKLFLLLFAMTISTLAQGNYSYPSSGFIKENNFVDWIHYTSTQYGGSGGPGAWDNGHKVGQWYANDLGKWDETRSLVNWTWTYNDIPTSATVTSVRIRFRAHNYDYNTFQFTMNNINHIWGDNNFNYYDAFNSTNQVYTTSITENPDGYAYFDVTFATGSPFCNAVNNAVQSAQYFFTLGIKITGSYQPPSYWYLSDYSGNGFDDHPAIDLQINYSTTLQTYHFFNNIEGTTNSGSINAKNDQTGTTSTYSSGSPASLDPRYIYSVTTNVLPFSANWNGSGYTEKDQYWNVNSNPTYVLTYDLQPDLDYIDGNLYSKFDKTYPATITTNIDGIVGGTVQLKDPWYYYSDGQGNWYQTNQFNSYSAPLSIQNSTGSYGGVFLNQPYNVIGKPYYSINFPSSQSISVGGTNHALYFLNWNATNATLQNSNSAQTPINFTGTGATATANVKGTQLSNDATAFSNNGQRKLIETKSGGITWLHQVYTSLGHVWIEHSSDGGSSWVLGNNGQPLDGTAGGKNPSIAYSKNSVNNYNFIGVVWQQPYGSHYKIMGKMFNQDMVSSDIPEPVTYVRTLHTEPSDAYGVNANPNLVLAQEGFPPYFVTFERKSTSGVWYPGINWVVGHVEDISEAYCGPFGYIENSSTSYGVISGTDASTINVQLSLYSGATGLDINLIRQQGSPGTIYSNFISFSGCGLECSPYQINDGLISYNATVNYSPSIVSLPDSVYAACWIEYNSLVFYKFGSSILHYYGDYVQSCSINRGGGNSNSGFAVWSQNPNSIWSNKSIRFDNAEPVGGSINTLSTSGKYVQVSNSTSSSGTSDMYVSSFYPFSSPYYFKTPSSTLSKVNTEVTTGRGFVINLEDAAFSYRFGDLNVDGKNISFVDAPDELDYGNVEKLNNALVTEPFQVNTNSKIIFSEMSGFTDTLAAAKKLGKDGFINFKMELIDDATGKVIAQIKSENLNSSNVHSVRTPAYSLNTNGITGKTVRIKISLESNLVTEYKGQLAAGDSLNIPDAVKTRLNVVHSNLILTKSFSEENSTLGKTSLTELAIDNSNIPTVYALDQNYPNPFNPTTVINYQIPKDGIVTLKIYDVLGREVKTLVNEQKTIGKYEVKFDARDLASGVYIYQIKVNDFTSSKKMLLMK